MKKLISLLLVLVLVVAMAVPAMALSTTTKTVRDSGEYKGYTYTSTTKASVSSASASLYYADTAKVSAQIVAQTYYTVLGQTGAEKTASDLVSGNSVTASVSAGTGCQFTEAVGNYTINGYILPSKTVK